VIDPISLGATLYLPATRPDLESVAFGGRYADLRSAIICLEDSVRTDALPRALQNLSRLVAAWPEAPLSRPHLFVRPRDPAMLAQLLLFPGMERIDGFVLPKTTADTLPLYVAALDGRQSPLMPTLETREIFEASELQRLRTELLRIGDQVIALRIGGNDLLQTLRTRRSAVRTIYEGPLAGTIANLIATFVPYGFSLCAPVFEHFGCTAVLREEVERDLEHGLLSKTAIHPLQIDPIHQAYAVQPGELEDAIRILADASPAVFASGGAMAEPATHRVWADTIVRRNRFFGTTPESGLVAAGRS
jgi:citrate lyase beta subunit